MLHLSQKISARVTTALLFLAVIGGNWDVWWHTAIGRESFWIPPHLMLYSGIMGALIVSAWSWYRFKGKQWMWLTILLALAPAAGPFDDIWHRMYGVEPVNSPWIIWSPPHMQLIFSIGASAVMLLQFIKRDDHREARPVTPRYKLLEFACPQLNHCIPCPGEIVVCPVTISCWSGYHC